MYFNAKDRYEDFCKTKKCEFDLYASQDVRNQLVEFEVIIHNVFISGYIADFADDPINNIMLISRRKLINSMRNDLGIK